MRFRRSISPRYSNWLVLVMSLAPMIILLGFSHWQAKQRAKASLSQNIGEAFRRTDRMLETADNLLHRLAQDTQNGTSPNTLNQLRRIVYNDPRFREAGVINAEGKIVLSSLGAINPPHISANPANPKLKQLQIIGPYRTTLMQEESIKLSLPTQGQGEMFLLVDPVIFTYLLNDTELGRGGFMAFTRKDGYLIAGVGAIPSQNKQILPQTDQSATQIHLTSDRSDLVAIAAVPNNFVLRNWWTDLLVGAPIAILSSLALKRLFQSTSRPPGLDEDIRLGLKNNEFEVYYQPLFDLQTGKCVGSEALMRWHHPERGMVPPTLFIPIAESTGLIEGLTDWLVQQIVKDQSKLLKKFPHLYVSLNLSPTQLASGRFSNTMIQTFAKLNIPLSQVMMELTESSLIEETLSITPNVIADVRASGIRFALDDFGTGYCSLSYLHKFEFDTLKIDRVFIRSIDEPKMTTAVLDTLIELGIKLSLTLIAEGIETEAQRDYLKQRGVHIAQGWLFAKAMPIYDFEQLLETEVLTQ